MYFKMLGQTFKPEIFPNKRKIAISGSGFPFSSQTIFFTDYLPWLFSDGCLARLDVIMIKD